MYGWIKLHRQLMDSDMYFAEPFTKMQAWIDLLLLASFEDCSVVVSGTRKALERGQICISQNTLASRWKWSRGKVDRYLNDLEMEQMIEQLKSHRTSTISIINYDMYQDCDTTDSTTDDTTDSTTDSTTEQEKKKEKKVTKEEKEEKEIYKERQENNFNPPFNAHVRTREEIVMEVWNDEYIKVKGTSYVPNWKTHTFDVKNISDALRKKMEESGMGTTDEEFEDFARIFFIKAYEISDEWQKRNWSMGMIGSQFSRIYSELIKPVDDNISTNGKQSGRQQQAADDKEWLAKQLRILAGVRDT